MSTRLETFGPNNSSAIMWIVLVLLVLVVLLVVLRLVRNMRGGTFIAGGRNRAPRLAVVDAAAVDAQRRLVLVRRDNVEHLILIGGPTDVVIEPGIQTGDLERALRERQMRAAAEARPKRPTAAPKVEPAPAPVQAPAVPPEPVHPRRHAVAVTPPEAEVVPEAPEPVTPPAPLPAQPQRVEPKMEPHVAPTSPAAEVPADTLDVAPSKKPSAQTPEAALETSLEEEMGRLLSDISVDDARQR